MDQFTIVYFQNPKKEIDQWLLSDIFAYLQQYNIFYFRHDTVKYSQRKNKSETEPV